LHLLNMVMDMNNYYAWFIFALLILLPISLIFAWTWSRLENERYRFDQFDHTGHLGTFGLEDQS
jgi:hypothetical protein